MSLTYLLEKYLTILHNPKYQKAQKLMDKKEKLRNDIKKMMKEQNLTKTNIVFNNKNVEYGFKVRCVESVDTKSLPEEIKKQYSVSKEYWYEYFR